MKKQSLFVVVAALLVVVCGNRAVAQDETPAPEVQKPRGTWSTSTTPALKISETMFNNWSSSGNSQITVLGTFFGNYKYTHAKYVWDNIADLAYGYAWQDLDNSSIDSVGGLFESRRKSADKIDLTSSLTFKLFKDWGANATANLKTQFGNGYEYTGVGSEAEDTKEKVSGFMSPAYLTTAISFELKRSTWSVSASFLTGKTTFVIDDSLIVHGKNYGVVQDDDFKVEDPGTYSKINNVYFALGSYIKAMYLKKDILPNLDLYARAELFYDYRKPKNMSWDDHSKSKYTFATTADGDQVEDWSDLDRKGWLARRAFETDLDFEVKLDYRLSSHISANLAVNLKWDTDFSGIGKWGHWQIYQMAGVQVFFNWKTPKV
ncbi:MAG: DUF3078 domain-containing protein [Bacteroidales bacterium]|nr:DUF3078 domain-containing protein [Bacteroidales bacterium]MBR1799831.1 DUF3078 domain-containing protein [Bacteroidales bacterium]